MEETPIEETPVDFSTFEKRFKNQSPELLWEEEDSEQIYELMELDEFWIRNEKRDEIRSKVPDLYQKYLLSFEEDLDEEDFVGFTSSDNENENDNPVLKSDNDPDKFESWQDTDPTKEVRNYENPLKKSRTWEDFKNSGDYEFYKNYLKLKWGPYVEVLFHLLRKYNLLDKIDDISLGRVRNLKEYVKNRQLVRFQVDFKYLCQLTGSGCNTKTPKTIPVNRDIIDLVKEINEGEVPVLKKIKNKIDFPAAISYSEGENVNNNKNLMRFISNLTKKEILTNYKKERILNFEMEEALGKEIFKYEKNFSDLVERNKKSNSKNQNGRDLLKPTTASEITGLKEEHLIERPQIKIPSYVEKVKIITQRDVLAWRRRNIEEICRENVSEVLKTQKCMHEKTSKIFTSTLKGVNDHIWTEVKNSKNNVKRKMDENPYLKEILKRDKSFTNYFETLSGIESRCVNSDKMFSDVNLNFNETESLKENEKEIQEFRLRTTVGKNCLQNSINILKKYDPDTKDENNFKVKSLTNSLTKHFEMEKVNSRDSKRKRMKERKIKRIESNKRKTKINKDIRDNIKIITDDDNNIQKAIQFLNQEANSLIKKKEMIIKSCTKFSKLFRADCNMKRNKAEIEMISCLPKMKKVLSEIGKSKSYNEEVLKVLKDSNENFDRFVREDLRRREASTSSRKYNFR